MSDHEGEAVWVPGADAASWSAQPVQAPPSGGGEPPALGRVRVYPTFTFPVYQSGPGGIGLDQQIAITDWRKQGADWAEGEARRQVAAALGEPSEDAVGGLWWMGRAKRNTFRWQPFKGTPRDALPVNPAEQPSWEPERPEEGQQPAEDVVTAATDGEGPSAWVAPAPGEPRIYARCGACGFVTGPTRYLPSVCSSCGGGDDRLFESNPEEQALSLQRRRRVREDDRGAAGLEDGLPGEEQLRRYEDRLAHFRSRRGDGEVPAYGYAVHRDRCEVCRDLEVGGDGAGRRLRVLPAGAGVTFVGGMPGESRHAAVDAVLDVLHTKVAAYEIPDDLSGVLDVDSMIGSLPVLMEGTGSALTALADVFGSSPVHASVVEMLAEFAGSLGAMADRGREVHDVWRSNPDNDHDLRRASGEVPRAALFNV